MRSCRRALQTGLADCNGEPRQSKVETRPQCWGSPSTYLNLCAKKLTPIGVKNEGLPDGETLLIDAETQRSSVPAHISSCCAKQQHPRNIWILRPATSCRMTGGGFGNSIYHAAAGNVATIVAICEGMPVENLTPIGVNTICGARALSAQAATLLPSSLAGEGGAKRRERGARRDTSLQECVHLNQNRAKKLTPIGVNNGGLSDEKPLLIDAEAQRSYAPFYRAFSQTLGFAFRSPQRSWRPVRHPRG